MRVTFLSARLWQASKGLMVLALFGGTGLGQAHSSVSDGRLDLASAGSVSVNLVPNTPLSPTGPGTAAASPVVGSSLPEAPENHRFWDNQNRALFAMVAALCAADFVVTWANLQSGGKELNPVTRVFSGSTAGLAANFAGETAGIVGLSYYLHRTGHHRLERITPMLNIGASTFAVVYDLSHR